ncbi:TPA: WYL domain-containing protein [Vibrio parahaemolyticus]|nr:WYL domain-containing protein [Vibrio parahaemolyticus]HCH5494726.1 WYL domain-containing protein [Vibrio parahaemolyticus]HCH6275967.1 WYL domain-containing protein [Vibrio parahaemolyticus]HCH6312408.1 WYL domain-containing protein [Vibrio parahaemolyticus]HCH6482994.1 WYL domain-containing protein [Vibrio parahaemolyticus]
MATRDSLAERLSNILLKLNSGEVCEMRELADEFAVNLRTIQRDVNVRLAFLPIEKDGSKIRLESSALGRLTANDIRNFAQICGVKELFPSMDNSFITSLLSNAYNSSYLVQGHHYENEANIKPLLKKLEYCIAGRILINFTYKGKSYEQVEPYKLVNAKGIWYLAAVDSSKLKTFHIAGLGRLFERSENFKPDPTIEDVINREDGIYFSEHKYEVVLKASAKVAHYFQRRSLLPHQVIEKELETGELILSSSIAHNSQIIPLIKYWIPDLEVISPKSLMKTIQQQCREFTEL